MKKLLVGALLLMVAVIGMGPAVADQMPTTPPNIPANPQTWAATINPSSGSDTESPTITTSGACPWPARAIIARIYGAGFPAEGMNVIGNTEAGVSVKGPFQTGMGESLRDTRNRLPEYSPYKGVYSIVVSCIYPLFPNKTYGDYTVKLNFTAPNAWVALPPPSSAVGPVRLPDGSYVPGDSDAAKKAAAAIAAGDRTGGTGKYVPAPGEATIKALAPSTQKASSTTNGDAIWIPITLIGIGLVIVAATLVALMRRRAS